MDTPDAPRPDPQPAPQPAPAAAPPPPVEKRPLLARLFGISVWGGVKLLALCILVGFFVLAANFDASEPDFNLAEA